MHLTVTRQLKIRILLKRVRVNFQLTIESHNILYVLKEICRRKTTDSYKALRIRAFEVLDQYSDIHNLTITQLSDYCYIEAINLVLNAWDLPENGDYGRTNIIQGLSMD